MGVESFLGAQCPEASLGCCSHYITEYSDLPHMPTLEKEDQDMGMPSKKQTELLAHFRLLPTQLRGEQ